MNKSNLSNKVNAKKAWIKTIMCKIFDVKIWLALFLVVVCIVVVLNPEKYLTVALTGIRVWATNVLPALFPFMVFSRLLTQTGCVSQAAKVFAPATKKLFNCPGNSAYIFLMSVISGYPLGAKLTGEAYVEGSVTRQEAHRICAFTSNSGPMFIIGTVASGMLKNALCGQIILISHITGAVLNGLIYKNYCPKPVKIEKSNEINQNKTSSIASVISSSVNSILLVGGFITIFFVLTEVLFSLGVFSPISLALSKLGMDSTCATGLVSGIFEMTKGCLLISSSSVCLALKTSLCCLLISFGGLAISFQALSFLNEFKISKKFFFLQKITHAIISFLICMGISFLLL